MSENTPAPAWRVESLTVKRGGSIDVTLFSPAGGRWNVSISKDGDWEIVSDLGALPSPAYRAAIMATVSNYSIRRTFGGES